MAQSTWLEFSLPFFDHFLIADTRKSPWFSLLFSGEFMWNHQLWLVKSAFFPCSKTASYDKNCDLTNHSWWFPTMISSNHPTWKLYELPFRTLKSLTRDKSGAFPMAIAGGRRRWYQRDIDLSCPAGRTRWWVVFSQKSVGKGRKPWIWDVFGWSIQRWTEGAKERLGYQYSLCIPY